MTRLDDVMKAKNVDEHYLSLHSGIRMKSLHAWRKGGKKIINNASAKEAVKVAQVLGVRVEDLLETEEPEEDNGVVDGERVELFLLTVELCNEIMQNIADTTIDCQMRKDKYWKEYAREIVEAMLVRKYYEGDNDVYLVSVVNSALKLLSENTPDGIRHELEDMVSYIERSSSGVGFSVNLGKGNYIPGTDFIFNLLYGEIMHGDVDRAKKMYSMPLWFKYNGLISFNLPRQKCLSNVYSVIKQLINDEYLQIND